MRSTPPLPWLTHRCSLLECLWWQVFNDATEYFSREGEDAPTLTDVIPSMDLIDERLATDMTNIDLDPAIRVAIGCAKRTINHYYDKSDESAAYRIAMSTSSCFMLYLFFVSLLIIWSVLDPRYKLQYFSENDWLPSWVSDARLAVEQAFEKDWKGRVSSGLGDEKRVPVRHPP